VHSGSPTNCSGDDGDEDPAFLQTSRSRDAVARSRALLARTAKLLGMESYSKPARK
jgi:hypothetical protein